MKRLELFNGKYAMPRISKLQSADSRAYREIQRMFEAMWKAYLVKGTKSSISLPFWAQQIKSPKLMNIALKLLSEAGYITVTTQPHRNWAEASLNEAKILTYVTEVELASIRKRFKYQKYVLSNTEVDIACANLTHSNGETSNTGLYRPGFAKSAQTQFQFDTAMMSLYQSEVVQLINYGIEKTLTKYPNLREDLANYSEVAKEIVEYYLHTNGTYNSGNRASDSRGRDIQGYLDKVGNPVGYKIMRSLLVIPEPNRNTATRKGYIAKLLFIAELAGYKSGTYLGKLRFGLNCYRNKHLPDLDLAIENDLKELPDIIWLQRLYIDIDNYLSNSNYKWVVPIELDMSASVLGFYGLLLGHAPYLERCNMTLKTGLNDAWGHETITNRKQFKSVMRQLYGSNLSPQAMWTDLKIPYTAEEAVAFSKELQEGTLAPANKLKDFMINNCQMRPEMTLDVWNEKFTVKCNKYFNRGERTIQYDLYDSFSNSIKRIHHTDTIRVPDLNSFRRYVATALIHHLDSRCMDTTLSTVFDSYQWCLGIHDAIICDTEASDLARNTYAKQLERVYNDRKSILQNYFRSVNIPASKQTEWKEVMKTVVPLEEPFKCSPMVLK